MANCSSNIIFADTDDYARVALPAAAAVAPSATEVGGLSEEESNNESGSDGDMESVIESEQGVIV